MPCGSEGGNCQMQMVWRERSQVCHSSCPFFPKHNYFLIFHLFIHYFNGSFSQIFIHHCEKIMFVVTCLSSCSLNLLVTFQLHWTSCNEHIFFIVHVNFVVLWQIVFQDLLIVLPFFCSHEFVFTSRNHYWLNWIESPFS